MKPRRLLMGTLQRLLRQPALWLMIVSGLQLPVLARGAELSMTLHPGFDPRRNYERSGYWTSQLARSLPPASSPYVLVVQGPDEWLSNERPPTGATEVAKLNAAHAEILRSAMAEQGLLTASGPLLLAGRVAALLRPMEIDGATAPSRHARFWPLWEVLAYSTDADTLSVALATVQTLESMGVPARIARYPAASGSFRFGVLLSRSNETADSVPWAQRVGDDFLLPMALSAKPVKDLQADELAVWSWHEVMAPGWNGSNEDGGATKEDPRKRKQPATLPDLCQQAKALGLECVPVGSDEGRSQTLLAISALIVALLGGWLALRLNRHRLRLLKARIRNIAKKKEVF